MSCELLRKKENTMPDNLEFKFQNWKKVTKLEFSKRDFLWYFKELYKEKMGYKYDNDTINHSQFGNIFKQYVSDKLIEEKWQDKNPEAEPIMMKKFIDWIFEDEARKPTWYLYYVKRLMSDWLKQRRLSQPTKIELVKEKILNIEELKKIEDYFLHYLGEGYFDAMLTKKQFWLGSIWRKKNFTKEQKEELIHWQKENYPDKVLEKLKRWKEELNEEEFDSRKQFIIELARSRGITVKQVISEHYPGKYYGLFTTNELERFWE